MAYKSQHFVQRMYVCTFAKLRKATTVFINVCLSRTGHFHPNLTRILTQRTDMINNVTTDYIVSMVTLITKFTDVPMVGYKYSLVAKFRQTCQKCFVLLTFPSFFLSYTIFTLNNGYFPKLTIVSGEGNFAV